MEYNVSNNNGLLLKTIKSTVKEKGNISMEELIEKANLLKENFSVAYTKYGIFMGCYPDFFEPLQKEFLTALRIFNKNKEFYAFRLPHSNKFRFRLRTDGEGKEIKIVESNQIIIGTTITSTNKNGWYKLSDGFKSDLSLPFTVNINKENRLSVKTINYIGFGPYGEATYTDSRIVGFLIFGKKELLEVCNEK